MATKTTTTLNSFDDILNYFPGKHKKLLGGKGFNVLCPVHGDTEPSLSISFDDNTNKILMKCQAGCETTDILKTVGLKISDLFLNKAPKTYKNENIEYIYYNTEGLKKHKSVKYFKDGKKQFIQYHFKNGEWIKGLGNIETYIYNLPEILAKKHSAPYIAIVEGEKCVEACRRIGILATTNPSGAGKWKPNHTKYLEDVKEKIVILMDNDSPGEKHAALLKSYFPTAKTINILPEIQGGDIADWIEKGGTLEQFEEILKNFQEKLQSEMPLDKETPWYDERGKFMPKILADHIHKDHNFCYAERYLEYKDGYWKETTKDKLKNIVNVYLKDSAQPSHLEGTIEFLRIQALKSPNDFDAYEDIVNLKNCMLKITKNNIITETHSPNFYSTLRINAEYDPAAECPQWNKFLSEALSENNINLVQEIAGYLILPVNIIKKAFILKGVKDTGKSVFLNVISELLNKDNISNVPIQDLSNDFKRARIFGRTLNIFDDLPDRAIEDPGMLKAITGRGTIPIERKGQDAFDYEPKTRFLFSCNHLPRSLGDKDSSFFDRFIIIPFDNPVPEEKQDKHLEPKLKSELNGILLWALDGLKRLMNNNWVFSETEETKAEKEKYRRENNNVLDFIEEHCCFSGNKADFALVTTFYIQYKKYCDLVGVKAWSQNSLTRELEKIGIVKQQVRNNGDRPRAYIGIKLNNLYLETDGR